MPSVYPGLAHLYGNMLAAVDTETTGTTPGYHEICQIAIQPLDENCEPLADIAPLNLYLIPKHRERMDPEATKVHRLKYDYLKEWGHEPQKAADLLVEWYKRLDLPTSRRIIPLAHNWPFDSAHLLHWLGRDCYEEIFSGHFRDTMPVANYLNDLAAFEGEKPGLERRSLKWLCDHFGVVNENPHDALSDCRAEAAVYRKLIEYGRC